VATDPKATVRRFNDEVLSQGKLDAIDEIIADDYVEHQAFPGLTPDKEGLRAFVTMFRDAFPDLSVDTVAVVAEGDEVWGHCIMSGTHTGEFMGIPPSGKKFSAPSIDRVRLRDGKAVEHWGVSDDMGMMTQLGVIPEMG
jgi:steroid delta-isomerase-like uncharacterized protein